MCTKFLADETAKDWTCYSVELRYHSWNVMFKSPRHLILQIGWPRLVDQKLRTYAERQAENKRKFDNNNQNQQQLLKKQNVVQAYVVGSGEKKSYGGSKPLCPKCNYHHDGECAPKTLTDKVDYPDWCLKYQGTKPEERCPSDESHVILLEELRVDDKLHFVEESIEVMDHKIKQLKRSRIPIIKVRWNSKRGPEFTWEREDQFKQKYPHLFTKTATFRSSATLA
ncbi:hypothetical protein Tco_0169489 [Tanacetum coccineum]